MLKWFIRLAMVLLVLAGVALVLLLGFYLTLQVVDRTNGTLVSGGETRRYLLYVPESYDPNTPAPLVISLHGLVQWPAHQRQLTGWDALADEQGFIVVYPRGTGFPLRWRAGGRGLDPAPDIAFLSDLIDALSAEYAIDPDRIYVNGMSNGGGMSFVLSCALSERIAAIGTVAGAYAYPWEACNPTRPVPAIVFHGTDDQIVPFRGGELDGPGWPLPHIAAWVQEYALRSGCDPDPVALEARGQARGVEYTGCAPAGAVGADVVFYTVDGGGHTWPGGHPIPALIAGVTSTDINATREMWTFFERHSMPQHPKQ
ncbi:MAG: extracellular catalytic domain type 1 short-chain-length polyhydroxyalkanoate depolymerase [Anaerolineae bacterium]